MFLNKNISNWEEILARITGDKLKAGIELTEKMSAPMITRKVPMIETEFVDSASMMRFRVRVAIGSVSFQTSVVVDPIRR